MEEYLPVMDSRAATEGGPHTAQFWVQIRFFPGKFMVFSPASQGSGRCRGCVWLLRKPVALPPIYICGVLGELERCRLSRLTFFLPAAS